jgi:hypothetical protein
MTPQQRLQYYSALQSRKASVFLYGTLEGLTDVQLRLCARALNLAVEENPVEAWMPLSALRRPAQVPTADGMEPPAIALRQR